MEPSTTDTGRLRSLFSRGSLTESIAGLASIVLAILGLAGIAPRYMLSISGIALGVALLYEGGVVVAEYSKLISARTGAREPVATRVGGLPSEALAGIAAIVLSILALLNIVPEVLMAIAAIVLGTGLMLEAGTMSRLNAFRTQAIASSTPMREALPQATGAEVLAGLSAIVLGILALIGVAPAILNLVSMLIMGSVLVVSSSGAVARTLEFIEGM